MKKILIIGYFGYVTNQIDGQTTKTRNLLQLLIKENYEVDYFDTQNFQYNILSVFVMLYKVIFAKELLYLPAHNNLTYIFPFIFILSKLFRTDIYYFVVGGWLVEFIKKKKLHKYFLKKIKLILCETIFLKEQLKDNYNIYNVLLFPNFRFRDISLPVPVDEIEPEVLKLVFMSRIVLEKGLLVIESLCEEIKSSKLLITISFFGPIADKDKSYFCDLISRFNFINYKGVLQPENVVCELQKFDVLILPTRYYTEGLPGAIVDAYMAGIPVVVTKWKHAKEFVNDRTGIIIPFDNPNQEFINTIFNLYTNRAKLLQLKEGALNESIEYSDSKAFEIIKQFLN